MHWQALALPRLERKVINGFRPNQLGYWLTSSRGTLGDERPLEWLKAENWHPDQLATRGRLDQRLASSRVVLIGAGALGSMIGELLVRAGVWDITIIDHDVVLAGNLVRHTLTLDDLGKNKAEALVRRLASISPSVRAVAVPDRFPGGSLDPRVLGADLVIDTTGEHSLLEAMAEAEWTGDPVFASFAISMHARRLFAFLARSGRFDVAAFDAAYAPFSQEERDRDEERPCGGRRLLAPGVPGQGGRDMADGRHRDRAARRRLAHRDALIGPACVRAQRERRRPVRRRHEDRPVTTFVTADRHLGVVLDDHVRGRLIEHCIRAGRKETGGILIGRYSDLHDQAIVTDATGPPRDSIRRRFSFVRGLVGVQRRLDGAWRHRDFYLGEWHFHPFMPADPAIATEPRSSTSRRIRPTPARSRSWWSSVEIQKMTLSSKSPSFRAVIWSSWRRPRTLTTRRRTDECHPGRERSGDLSCSAGHGPDDGL